MPDENNMSSPPLQNETKDNIKPKVAIDFSKTINFANLSKHILKDLQKNNKEYLFFSKYKKEDIITYLKNPDKFEKQLRDASIYLYNASSHYRRLINYFAKMALMTYIVVPYKLDTNKINKKMFLLNYKRILNLLENMNIKHEFNKVMTIAFREDVFYGYEYSTNESYFIQKLPPDFCQITFIEDGVYNFSFDFSYFDSRKDKLVTFGTEFEAKYLLYAGDKDKKIKGNPSLRWQEIDSNRSICIKINEDLEYPLIPFAGIFESLYDIQDFKALKKAKEEIDNYKILSLTIPINKDTGDFLLDGDLAQNFYDKTNDALPEGVGLILTPMSIGEHSFQKNANADSNAVADAESSFYNSAGVSSLVFNNEKASSSALIQSIRSDADIVFSVLRQIERWINRKLKNEDTTYKFKIQILDITRYNQQEAFDNYLKAGNAGLPFKTALCATLGYSPSDVLCMSYLENDVLQMRDKLFNEPLLSSSTMSPDKETGRPKQKVVGDSGEQTREDDSNENRV